MTKEQIEICNNFAIVRFMPASFDKRFAGNLTSLAKYSPEKELTEKQNEWMFRLLYKYRKQLPKTYEKHKGNPLCSKKV